MKTVVLLTGNNELLATVETYCYQHGLSIQLPLTIEECKEQLQKSNEKLAILDLNDCTVENIRDIPAIVIGRPEIISDRINELGKCEDIIPMPVMPDVLFFRLNKVIEKVKLSKELKNAREEIKKLNIDVDSAYDEWEKTDRVLKASSLEIEKEKNNLKELNWQLEKLNKMKSDFLTTVSHELKTPLSSIKAFSEILMDDKIEPTEVIEFLNIINSESNRLDRMINNLLMTSRIETGKIYWKMDAVSMNRIIEKAVDSIKLDIKENGLRLETNIAPGISEVYGDKDKLVDVVNNLLSNAINFTPTDGTIKINVAEQMIADKGLEIWVSIQDTGIGIKYEEQEKIFDKFYQIKKNILTDKPKGMGLGLAICKEIIKHHGGRIWVESKQGEGSSFTFSLPVINNQECRSQNPE
ncbi:MAG: HAMP domain-containing sensor histidine kinase [bacterium]